MTRDIFNEPISVFLVEMGEDKRGLLVQYSCKHFTRTIGRFLGAGEIYRDNIAAARKARAGMVEAVRLNDMQQRDAWKRKYDACKWLSPCAMLGGVSPDRKQFTSYSNVLCIDIDAPKPGEKDNGNAWVTDWEQQKRKISDIKCVSYCSLSAGGAGLFVLIPIADHAKHEAYFDTLSAMFREHMGLTVDAQTRNINRLRFMSYDPAPYVNHNAQVFDTIKPRVNEYRKPINPPKICGKLSPTERARVEWCAKYCIENGVSITENYDEWLRVLAFFSHYWDDDTLAHELASLSPKYRPGENDRKLANLSKPHAHPATAKTFMYICRNNGVPVPPDWLRGYRHERPTFRALRLQRTPSEPRETGERTSSELRELAASEQREIGIFNEFNASKRNTQRTAGEQHELAESQQREIAAKKSERAKSEQRGTPMPPAMSAGEQFEMELRADYIAEGCAMVEAKRASNAAFDALCIDFGLQYCGHGDDANEWHMTAAQFENFWHERANAPVPF